MFYIHFNFKQKDGDEATPSGESFFIAWSERECNLSIARLMADPNVHNITCQVFEPVGDPRKPFDILVAYEDEAISCN